MYILSCSRPIIILTSLLINLKYFQSVFLDEDVLSEKHYSFDIDVASLVSRTQPYKLTQLLSRPLAKSQMEADCWLTSIRCVIQLVDEFLSLQ